MNKKQIVIRLSLLAAGAFVITLLTINIIGPSLENIETRIYQKISGKKAQYIQYDSTGVPMVVYEGNLGNQYNTVTVAEKAIKLSNETDTTDSGNFFSCIQWLTDHYANLNDSSIIFLNYYDWPGYKMTSPWRSAMNQGRAMQAFILAFEKTNDSSYLEYARKSMNTLFTDVKNGGVSYFDDNGYWYEEYADDSVPQTRVLNGMIVTLQGLSDYYKVTKDKEAQFLLEQGEKAVKNSLHLYDNNGHSNYDITGKPTKSWYHQFHIELLEFLYAETQDPVFKMYQEKWAGYKEPTYLAKLIKEPARIGFVTVISLFVGYLFLISIIGFFLSTNINDMVQLFLKNKNS